MKQLNRTPPSSAARRAATTDQKHITRRCRQNSLGAGLNNGSDNADVTSAGKVFHTFTAVGKIANQMNCWNLVNYPPLQGSSLGHQKPIRNTSVTDHNQPPHPLSMQELLACLFVCVVLYSILLETSFKQIQTKVETVSLNIYQGNSP